MYCLQADDPQDWFPAAELALAEPDGLLAIGGRLTRTRLLAAYRNGIFPWFSEGDPPLWWSPDPRCVFDTRQFHASRSLLRAVRKSDYGISLNRCFMQVMQACAEIRAPGQSTWINSQMLRAYADLHQHGHAHSLEVWRHGQLIGGIYGVSIGRMFFGESMFSRANNVSKLALYWLCQQMAHWDMPLLDAQVASRHLLSLGAVQLPRRAFLLQTRALAALPAPNWRLTVGGEPERLAHLPQPAQRAMLAAPN